MGRPKADKPRSEITNVRLTADEKHSFEERAAALGFSNISEYIRYVHNQSVEKVEQASTSDDYKARFPKKLIRSFHKTAMGEMLWGDSRAHLFHGAKPNSVDLIMTSPPF